MTGPQIVVGARHRIAQHLLTGRQAERQMREDLLVQRGRECALGNQTAPGDVARIGRNDAGQEMATDARADAVAADQHCATLRWQIDAGLRILEIHGDAITVLGISLQAPTGV